MLSLLSASFSGRGNRSTAREREKSQHSITSTTLRRVDVWRRGVVAEGRTMQILSYQNCTEEQLHTYLQACLRKGGAREQSMSLRRVDHGKGALISSGSRSLVCSQVFSLPSLREGTSPDLESDLIRSRCWNHNLSPLPQTDLRAGGKSSKTEEKPRFFDSKRGMRNEASPSFPSSP